MHVPTQTQPSKQDMLRAFIAQYYDQDCPICGRIYTKFADFVNARVGHFNARLNQFDILCSDSCFKAYTAPTITIRAIPEGEPDETK